MPFIARILRAVADALDVDAHARRRTTTRRRVRLQWRRSRTEARSSCVLRRRQKRLLRCLGPRLGRHPSCRCRRRSPPSLARVGQRHPSYRWADRRRSRPAANPSRPRPKAQLRSVDCWRCHRPRMRRYFCCATPDRIHRLREPGRRPRTANPARQCQGRPRRWLLLMS